ncbi:MAG: hypothetical protein AB1801_18990 [Chloroflexota bacterium]
MNTLLPLQPPTKEIDIDFLVFVERYATDLLKWDILSFFAHHPNFCVPASKVASHIGRSVHSVRPELGDLVMVSVLNQVQKADGQPLYQLTERPPLRAMALKFATLIAVVTPG